MTSRPTNFLRIGAFVFALLYAAAAVRYWHSGFVSLQGFVNLLSDNAVLGMLSIGMTFVILSGGIDLSVGAVMSAASVLIAVLIMQHGMNVYTAIVLTLAAGTAFGLLMGLLIHGLGIKPFVATLAGTFIARGAGYLINLESIGIADAGHAKLAAIAISIGGVRLPITAILFLALLAVSAYVLRLRPFGRNIYAIGGDENAAMLMGIRIGPTKIAVYAVSGFCAALGGVALTLYLSSGTHIEGQGLELDAIACVVIGGTLLTGGVGSVMGTLIGVLVIGLILNVITYENLNSGLTRVWIGTLLLMLILVHRLQSRASRDHT